MASMCFWLRSTPGTSWRSGASVDRAFLRHEVANVAVGGKDFEVLPRYFLMVFALAGDSTITRLLLKVV